VNAIGFDVGERIVHQNVRDHYQDGNDGTKKRQVGIPKGKPMQTLIHNFF